KRAFSSEVGTGSRQENAKKEREKHFQAKWFPVRVKKIRKKREKHFQAKWEPVRVKEMRSKKEIKHPS
ncbi:MAG: hypothetical protein LW833_03895, partial [Hyphomicrobiales bacterium]|nr:hypothetical protein [Hyphomicrobiales bacterium]